MIDIAFDPDIVREAASCRVPTTEEELWHFCKYVLQLPCEACGGTGIWATADGEGTCLWCHGHGRIGMHFSRMAICPGHVAPMRVLWELWSGTLKHVLIVGNRGGGKTLLLAVMEFLKMWFQRYSVCHMGAVENQANRAREHFHRIVLEPPWSSRLGGQEPGKEGVRFVEGGRIEWLPGTLKQASGPHPELSVLDEVDECEWAVRQRFLKTPFGPRAQFIESSTHYIQLGTISRIEKESSHLPMRKFCLWETLERCEYDCDEMPLLDGTIGRCPLYESEEVRADGTVQMVTLCGGEIARRCDGHIPVPSAASRWAQADVYTRRVEFLCEKPGMTLGARAFHAFSPEVCVGDGGGNVLPFNPTPRSDSPLMWSMDFNPGRGMPMSSLVLQQAPPEFGQEWWILDEITLLTSSTKETIDEFVRRYGVGGHRLSQAAQDTGHLGGLWIFGDATGHTRQSLTGETDYDLVVSQLRNTPGFRLMVPYGSANPSLIDRLNTTNRMLCDHQGAQAKRWLKIAPRCVGMLRELELMPLGADRKKDKSTRIQQLGLSHLSDALEYWVAVLFPRGPGTSQVGRRMLLSGQRASTELGIISGGRRSSMGDTGGPSPWLTGKDRHLE